MCNRKRWNWRTGRKTWALFVVRFGMDNHSSCESDVALLSRIDATFLNIAQRLEPIIEDPTVFFEWHFGHAITIEWLNAMFVNSISIGLLAVSIDRDAHHWHLLILERPTNGECFEP
jgi:hypothetical protein